MRQGPWGGLLIVVATLSLTSACAYTKLGEDGSRRTVGLAQVTYTPAIEQGSFTGCISKISGIGTVVSDSPLGRAVVLGWFQEISAPLREASSKSVHSASCPQNGFDWIDISMSGPKMRIAGATRDLSAVGFGIVGRGQKTDMIIGYARAQTAMVADNAAVCGNPLQIEANQKCKK